MTSDNYSTEWCLLQNQFDSYEKHSLYIKLVSVGVCAATWLSGFSGIVAAALLVLLWGQDAIWKTFQSRIETRLLLLEQSIAGVTGRETPALQFNSEYLKSSKSGVGLIGEYIAQAVRPTIAYPHVVLIPLLMLQMYLFNS